MEDFSEYNGEGTELRKAQLRMLDILTAIDTVCRRHDIPYWLDFGTLLGAVRHGGFIPWDDDLDITIFKRDDKRLQQYLQEELPPCYYVMSERTHRRTGRVGYFRVIDRRSHVLRPWQDEAHLTDDDNGIWVDVFNIEKGHAPFKHFLDRTHGRALRRTQGLIEDGSFKRAAARLLLPFTSSLLAAYRGVQRVVNHDTYIYNLPNCIVRQMFSERTLPQILPLSDILFEGHSFQAPYDADAFLRTTYGDYMTIPPREKRVVHNSFIQVNE